VDRSDYGALSKPPSDLASTVVSAMTDEERHNFFNLLDRLQSWHESLNEKSRLTFHPEARAAFWGVALAKIADHFREVGQNPRALFFMGAAWNISKYPVFAFNAALLCLGAGDHDRARHLFNAFLAEYQNVLSNDSMMLANPGITADRLESIASSVRDRLATIYPT
jgi:hypothetical protein